VKVFLSWSGEKSKAVADALRDWLPSVIQQVKPFMSDEDIAAGARWQQRLAEELQGSSFGVLCVTRENQSSPWLNFEAGAIAKEAEWSHVVPLAIDLSLADLKPPLSQFQAKEATKSGLLSILESINACLKDPLPNVTLLLDVWWPELQPKLDAAATVSEPTPVRTDRELVEEVLALVRSLARDDYGARPLLDRQTISELARRRAMDELIAALPTGSGVGYEGGIGRHVLRIRLNGNISNDLHERLTATAQLLVADLEIENPGTAQ
jgi:TIR domain